MLNKNAVYLMGSNFANLHEEKIGTRYLDTSSGRVKKWDGSTWVDVGVFSVSADRTIFVTEAGSTPDCTIHLEMRPC